MKRARPHRRSQARGKNTQELWLEKKTPPTIFNMLPFVSVYQKCVVMLSHQDNINSFRVVITETTTAGYDDNIIHTVMTDEFMELQ